MSTATYRCPRCPAVLGRTTGSPPGSRVRCPGCQHVFAVPDLNAVVEEPPPLLQPEEEGPSRRRRPAPGPRRVQLTNAYKPDFSLYFRMAYGPWADFLWPYMGFLGAGGAIIGVIYAFGVITAPILLGLPFLGIIPILIAQSQLIGTLPMGPAIKAVLGRDYETMDFIYGLERIIPILGFIVMNATFFLLAYGPMIGIIIYLMVQMGGPQPFFASLNSLVVIGLIAYTVLVVPLLYMVVFARFGFALCLVFDRKMGFFEAMTTSWKMTEGHFFSMLWLLLIQGGLAFLGALPCGAAMGATMSYAFLLRAAAYVHATTPSNEVAFASPGQEPDEDDYPSVGL